MSQFTFWAAIANFLNIPLQTEIIQWRKVSGMWSYLTNPYHIYFHPCEDDPIELWVEITSYCSYRCYSYRVSLWSDPDAPSIKARMVERMDRHRRQCFSARLLPVNSEMVFLPSPRSLSSKQWLSSEQLSPLLLKVWGWFTRCVTNHRLLEQITLYEFEEFSEGLVSPYCSCFRLYMCPWILVDYTLTMCL